MRIAIAIAVVVVVAACGDSPNPVAPTVSPPSPPPSPPLPPPSPPSTIDIDFAFDAAFYQALVHNGYEDPGNVYRHFSVVLMTTSPNFYIRRSTPDDTMPGCGRRWTLDQLSYMERMIPRLVEQLTGEPYRGQVISGCEDRRQAEWITIVSATTREEPRLAGACGMAEVGAYGAPGGSGAGRMWFNENPNSSCTRAYFSRVFVHELGHAMGFYHVPNGFGYVMAKGEYPGRDDFTVKERQHAQHAYKRGRYADSCDDVVTCSSKAFGITQGRLSLWTQPALP